MMEQGQISGLGRVKSSVACSQPWAAFDHSFALTYKAREQVAGDGRAPLLK